MTAEELINQMLPPLKTTDTVEVARRWMEEFRVSQFPVVKNQEYEGMVSEEAIFQSSDSNTRIADLPLVGEDVFANRHQHFYEVLKVALDHQVQVVPVVNEERKFIGAVTVNDALLAFAQSAGMQEPGGILVLLMDEREYSLAEISRLVEANDARILSSHASPDGDNRAKIRLTLKLNRNDISRIVATLERFDYHVVAQFQNVEVENNDKERLDLLLKYLNI
ncbi:MAG: CBS domain-containing protein [Ferruginibacter sp.]|nr:CBS domain-containing protein [Cytophagales bacterium]